MFGQLQGFSAGCYFVSCPLAQISTAWLCAPARSQGAKRVTGLAPVPAGTQSVPSLGTEAVPTLTLSQGVPDLQTQTVSDRARL